MKKFKALGAVLVAAMLSMGTVSNATAATSTLKLGAIGKVVSFAGDQAQYGNNVWYYQAVYDTLLRKTENGTLIPGIATKWAYNADKTVLTLTLRSGVKFTDGTALTPAAVVANLIANRDSNGTNASYLESMKTATAKGSDQVVITLKEIDPALLEYLADCAGILASPKSIGTDGAKTTPVGSGPYTLDKARTISGSKYVFKANPTYWDKANRKYDNLEIYVYEDTTAMSNALKSGAIQGGNLWPQFVKGVKAAGFSMASQYGDVEGIYFSDRTGAHSSCIADVNVRRAINSVFDRAALLKSLSNGAGKVTTQYLPQTNPGYQAEFEKKYPFSESAAKAFMSKSGFKNGCKITMPTLTPIFGASVYAIIKAQLGKINITVDETEENMGTFISNLTAPKYDASLMMFERSANPWTLIKFMISKNASFNNDHYGEAKVSQLMTAYKKADDTKRKLILKSINTELVNNAWFSPWYALQSNFAYKGIVVKGPQSGNVIPFLYNIK